jgi:hypothetical protein
MAEKLYNLTCVTVGGCTSSGMPHPATTCLMNTVSLPIKL